MHIIFKTLNNEFCKFHYRKFQRNTSSGRPTWNGQDWNCFWKFFTFEKFSSWAGRPWESGHLKNLCVFPPPLNVPSSLWSSSSSVFEPLLLFERLWALAFLFERLWALASLRAPLSPHFFFSAPLSPHFVFERLGALTSFRVRLRALYHSFECAFKLSTILLSAPSSPHFLLFFTWVGHPSQWDHF